LYSFSAAKINRCISVFIYRNRQLVFIFVVFAGFLRFLAPLVPLIASIVNTLRKVLSDLLNIILVIWIAIKGTLQACGFDSVAQGIDGKTYMGLANLQKSWKWIFDRICENLCTG
jgi:hypothetical protein